MISPITLKTSKLSSNLIILKMPSRESREGIRIRDRISISYNNGRVFAFGEDSLALRLASELCDVRNFNQPNNFEDALA